MSRSYDIFLSHSGVQKKFVEPLYEELRRVCGHYSVFFDRDAIKYGEEISTTILEYAKTCKLAVAVLSEEYFTRSKPPMMELAASYTAAKDGSGGPCLLPIFLTLKPEDAKDYNVQLEWRTTWQKWEVNEKMSERRKSKTSRVQPMVWKEAVDKLLDTLGPVYKPHEYENDPEVFMKKVAQVIADKLGDLNRSLELHKVDDERMQQFKVDDERRQEYKVDDELRQEYKVEDERRQEYKVDDERRQEYKVDDERRQEYKVEDERMQQYKEVDPREDASRKITKFFKTVMGSASTRLRKKKMAGGKEVLREPNRVVVCLEFHAKHTQFSFSHTADPDHIFTRYKYPKGPDFQPSRRTRTAIYYYPRDGDQSYQVRAWGDSALSEYERDKVEARRSSERTVGIYVTNFNPHLTRQDMQISIPEPLLHFPSVEIAIKDYLHEMGAYILKWLQSELGIPLTMKMIQWCVPVPPSWDNAAKEKMETCMEAAGLVNGADGSPHPVKMVVELEAASCFILGSQRSGKWKVGDKVLIVDMGEEAFNTIIQEVVSICKGICRVKELTSSLFTDFSCPGYKFRELLHEKIGPGLQEFLSKNPTKEGSEVSTEWNHFKLDFGTLRKLEIILPSRWSRIWKSYDQEMGNPERESYREIEISDADMRTVFDPVMVELSNSISRRYDEVGGVRALVVVGGSNEWSGYVTEFVKRRFSSLVPVIINSPNYQTATCKGTVLLNLDLCNATGTNY